MKSDYEVDSLGTFDQQILSVPIAVQSSTATSAPYANGAEHNVRDFNTSGRPHSLRLSLNRSTNAPHLMSTHLNASYEPVDVSGVFETPQTLITDTWCCGLQRYCYPSKTARSIREMTYSVFECFFNLDGSWITRCMRCSDPCERRIRYRRIPNENLLILSVIQLLCGFASIILSSVALTKLVFLYRMATGMWAGFLMLVTGTQGLITARRPILCTLIALLVMCAITTTSACLLIGVSVAGTIEDGFLHATGSGSRSSVQLIKFTYAFQENDHPFKSVYSRSDQLDSLKTLNSTGNSPLRFRSVSNDLILPNSDSHLRTCQVILHILLLLVGVLESSVGLSTSVFCCRYVCFRSTSSRITRNPHTTRTNIVSLDAATANQAAAILESGNVGQFVGTGNFLLAVAANSLSENEANGAQNTEIPPLSDPHIHHSVAPFLPESTRSPLILTQAGTGSMAWTAARAAATLIDRTRSYPEDNGVERSAPPTSLHHTSNSHSRNRRLCVLRRSNRPRFMFTSFNTPCMTRLTDAHQDTSSGMYLSDTGISSFPNGSTLLYVMPSPSRDEPPMIFPPFPPTYSSLQKRPSATAFSRVQPPAVRSRGAQSTSQEEALPTGRRRWSIFQIFSPRRIIRRRFTSRSHRSRQPPSRVSNSRMSSSSLMCAVDRLLQPVLIVDPGVCLPHADMSFPADPPKYSSIPQDMEEAPSAR